MTGQELNRRRALIVRRWAAYRVGRAQREIWRKRRTEPTDDLDETAGDADGLLAELHDGLIS